MRACVTAAETLGRAVHLHRRPREARTSGHLRSAPHRPAPFVAAWLGIALTSEDHQRHHVNGELQPQCIANFTTSLTGK